MNLPILEYIFSLSLSLQQTYIYIYIYIYILIIKTIETSSVMNYPGLKALRANPRLWLFVLLFFHPLDWVCCVLCIGKEMWNIPGQRWEKPLDDSDGHE